MVSKGLHYTDEVWFEHRQVGSDMLERFMKINLCKSVKLDGGSVYTNHSIRATVISMLDCQGFKACHIIALSSHKSESTVKQYSVQCPNTKRKEMFESLSNAIAPKSKKSKQKDQQNTDLPPDLVDVKLNLQNFQLQPLDGYKTIDDATLNAIMNDLENDQQNKENNKQTEPNQTTPQTNQQNITQHQNVVGNQDTISVNAGPPPTPNQCHSKYKQIKISILST